MGVALVTALISLTVWFSFSYALALVAFIGGFFYLRGAKLSACALPWCNFFALFNIRRMMH
jgi:hypothetical protein